MGHKSAIWKARLAALLLGGLATGGFGLYFTFFIANGASQAGYTVLIGLFAMVVIDQAILLFDHHEEHHQGEVIDILKRIEGSLPQPTDKVHVKELERFRDRRFHHYHLTKDETGRCTWVHKILYFDVQQSSGKIITRAPILLKADADRKANTYQFEASISGPHLLLLAHKPDDGNPDIGVELFPYIGHSPFYGARIITTDCHDEPVTTISIMSTTPRVKNVEEGPMSDADGKTLQEDWDKHAAIGRLPLLEEPKRTAPPRTETGEKTSINVEVFEKGTWNDHTVQQALRQAREGEVVRVWTTFFLDPTGTNKIFRQLIERGVKIDVILMNPENQRLVRSRFRNRTDYDQDPPTIAQDTIRGQLNTLRNIAREMNGHSKGSLKVTACDTMPFAAFYQIGEQVIFAGLLLCLDAWAEGPLMKFYPSSPQWQVLVDNWEACSKNPLDNDPVAAA